MLIGREETSVVYNKLGKERLYFDGAMGTMLQQSGLKLGELPEVFNITHPEIIENIHRAYLAAGSHFITTNTFGANGYKFKNTQYSVSEIIEAAVDVAKRAQRDYQIGRAHV